MSVKSDQDNKKINKQKKKDEEGLTKRNILICIEDDGPGIPISEYENVFKPFYKIDKSRNQKKSSVGLGLSITSILSINIRLFHHVSWTSCHDSMTFVL